PALLPGGRLPVDAQSRPPHIGRREPVGLSPTLPWQGPTWSRDIATGPADTGRAGRPSSVPHLEHPRWLAGDPPRADTPPPPVDPPSCPQPHRSPAAALPPE